MRIRILCYLAIGILCLSALLWWHWRSEAEFEHRQMLIAAPLNSAPIPGAAEEMEAEAKAEEEARRLEERIPPSVILKGHYDGSHRVAVSPDGSTFLTASQDGTARLWTRTGELHRLEGHLKTPFCVAFSTDGKLAATGDSGGLAIVWEVATGDIVAMLTEHYDNLRALSFLPDGKLLTTSRRGGLRLWDVQREVEIAYQQIHKLRVMGLAVSRDGARAYTVAADNTMACSRLPSLRLVWESDGRVPGIDEKDERSQKYPPLVTSLHLSVDERKLYSVRSREGIDEWDAETGKHLRRLRAGTRVFAIALHPDGRHIAIEDWDNGNLALWELTSGDAPLRLVRSFAAPAHVHDIAFGPQGRFMVIAQGGAYSENFRSGWSVADNGHVFLWDLPTNASGLIE